MHMSRRFLCSKCLRLLVKKSFYKNRNNTHGIDTQCKRCRKVASKGRYLRNKTPCLGCGTKIRSLEWNSKCFACNKNEDTLCRICLEIKPRHLFYKNRKGVRTECMDCHSMLYYYSNLDLEAIL